MKHDIRYEDSAGQLWSYRANAERTGTARKVLVLPLDDKAIGEMLVRAKCALTRRTARRRDPLPNMDAALVVMHSLGIFRKIKLR